MQAKRKSRNPASSESTTHCPACGAVTAVHPVTVLRPGEGALLDLFKGRLNRATCGACRQEFLVDVPLLYRDDERRCLLYFVPIEEGADTEAMQKRLEELARKAFAAADAATAVTCWVTTNRRSFIEKISLCGRGLEDRLVEYIKYQIYNSPDRRVDGVRSELFYDFSFADNDSLAFIAFDRESGKATGQLHIPMEVYRDLADLFRVDTGLQAELERLFPGYIVSCDRLL